MAAEVLIGLFGKPRHCQGDMISDGTRRWLVTKLYLEVTPAGVRFAYDASVVEGDHLRVQTFVDDVATTQAYPDRFHLPWRWFFDESQLPLPLVE